MGLNKENRPPADFFPTEAEGPAPYPGAVAGIAVLPDVDLTLASGDNPITLTNLPSGETTFLSRSLWFNARGAAQVRGVIDDVNTAGSAGSKARIKFRTTAGGTRTNPGVSGATVDIPIDSTGPQKSGWVNIDPDATNDVLWDAVGLGGNGTADPVIGGVHVQFRYSVPALCPDGGCPMPADIYNGEDFSADQYADEATFLAVAEDNDKNFYNVWYGFDGSVEGCSYGPVTFCGNPVVRGRWKALSEGSNVWDIIGYGSWTRFANPLLDTGGSGGGQLVRFRSVWTTIRFQIESGWTADDGYGFTISDLFNDGNGINGECVVLLRGGRVIVRATANSATISYTEYDVGPSSMLVGTSGFVEVTIHGIVADQGSGVWRVTYEVFINPACSNGEAGDINTATPAATYTDTVVPIPIGGVVNNLGFYDWDKFNYTTDTAQWPEKYIDVAQAFYSGSLT